MELNRPLFFILVVLIALNGYLGWELVQVRMSSRVREERVLADLEALRLQVDGSKQAIEELRVVVEEASDLVDTPAPTGEEPAEQLLIAQTLRVDYLVEWVDILERRLYFLIFPPTPGDRERIAAELQARTEKTKGDFASVARRSGPLRDALLARAAARNGPISDASTSPASTTSNQK